MIEDVCKDPYVEDSTGERQDIVVHWIMMLDTRCLMLVVATVVVSASIKYPGSSIWAIWHHGRLNPMYIAFREGLY